MLTFVLTIGLLVQIVGFILDGVSAALIGKFALVSFPETLQWTIPLSLLVSSVLVFSRLSADSEIAAMRACGVNLLAVMRYPILFALACSAMGAWVNNEIVPRGHEVRRSLKTSVSVSTGLDVLEPGRWIDDFPKVKIYFGSKEGAWLKDLIVMDYSYPKIDRMIDENHPGMMRVSRYSYVVKDALQEKEYKKKIKDLRFMELWRSISDSYAQEKTAMERLFNLKKDGWAPAEAKAKFAADPEAKALRREIRRSRSKSKVELSKRFVYAMASLCFVLVGVPLGIRAQRRESSIGMAMSLLIAMSYYLVVLLMLSLQKNYSMHPEFVIWTPVGACFALAAYFTRKHL